MNENVWTNEIGIINRYSMFVSCYKTSYLFISQESMFRVSVTDPVRVAHEMSNVVPLHMDETVSIEIILKTADGELTVEMWRISMSQSQEEDVKVSWVD